MSTAGRDKDTGTDEDSEQARFTPPQSRRGAADEEQDTGKEGADPRRSACLVLVGGVAVAVLAFVFTYAAFARAVVPWLPALVCAGPLLYATLLTAASLYVAALNGMKLHRRCPELSPDAHVVLAIWLGSLCALAVHQWTPLGVWGARGIGVAALLVVSYLVARSVRLRIHCRWTRPPVTPGGVVMAGCFVALAGPWAGVLTLRPSGHPAALVPGLLWIVLCGFGVLWSLRLVALTRHEFLEQCESQDPQVTRGQRDPTGDGGAEGESRN
jgi:hypothetical protein